MGRLIYRPQLMIGHAVWGLLVGGLLAVSIPLFFVGVVLVWLSVLIELLRTQPAHHRIRISLSLIGVQSAAIGTIVTIAALAPVKTADRLLQQPFTLPRTEMSLGELQEMTENSALRVPLLRRVNLPNCETIRVVRWPAKELTLREFITILEEQSPLRHRFSGCGNGQTILWGNDCSFGLYLFVPAEPGNL